MVPGSYLLWVWTSSSAGVLCSCLVVQLCSWAGWVAVASAPVPHQLGSLQSQSVSAWHQAAIWPTSDAINQFSAGGCTGDFLKGLQDRAADRFIFSR